MFIIKQSVGIDIAKLTFTACVCSRSVESSKELTFSVVRTFENNKTGFNKFVKWVGKTIDKDVEVLYAMEATGIYYEQLAYHLNNIGKIVTVQLPNKVMHYAKSLNIKSKTDDIDASVIAMMSCERELEQWRPPSLLYKKLRSVTRMYNTLQQDKVQISNRLDQLKCSFQPLKESLKFHKNSIERLNKELTKLESRMEEILRSDEEIWSKVKNLETIKGVGIKTIAIVLSETQGFSLIRNLNQLISYSGYDVVKRESGTSILGRTRISKRGNSRIRAALFFPSLSAVRFNPKMKEVYERINKGKSVKSVGLVAVQRRLLVLMCSLWKSNMPYDPDYEAKKVSGNHKEEVTSSSSTHRVETMTA